MDNQTEARAREVLMLAAGYPRSYARHAQDGDKYSLVNIIKAMLAFANEQTTVRNATHPEPRPVDREAIARALWNVQGRKNLRISWESAKTLKHGWVEGCYQHADAVIASLPGEGWQERLFKFVADFADIPLDAPKGEHQSRYIARRLREKRRDARNLIDTLGHGSEQPTGWRSINSAPRFPTPQQPGGYVGDTYYQNGGSVATHRWDGRVWQPFPSTPEPAREE